MVTMALCGWGSQMVMVPDAINGLDKAMTEIPSWHEGSKECVPMGIILLLVLAYSKSALQ